MKKFLIALCLCATLFACTGCPVNNQPMTNVEKLQLVDTTYDSILLALNVAHRHGILSVADKVAIDPYVQAAAAARVALHKADAVNFSAALAAFDAAVQSLVSHPIAIKANNYSKTAPATKPVSQLTGEDNAYCDSTWPLAGSGRVAGSRSFDR